MRQHADVLKAAARAVLLGANVSALRLAPDWRLLVEYSRHALFTYRHYSGSHGLRTENVFDVFPLDRSDVVLTGMAAGRGVTPWFGPGGSPTVDIVNLCLLCRAIQPKVIFEIGTFVGYTAHHLAANRPPGGRVFTLDLAPEETPSLHTTAVDDAHISARSGWRLFHGTPEAEAVTELYGDSASFDFTPFQHTVDLFFVDGAHSYDYVRSDTANALACVRPGGVIAWHDFGREGVNGVSRCLRELARDRRIYCPPGGSLAFTIA